MSDDVTAQATHDAAQRPAHRHRRPGGASDATVEAVGKLSDAFETIEQARGFLYGFHRLSGHADLLAGEAADQLRAAGHTELADRIETELVGRNILPGRWSFQVVEEYDEGYYDLFRSLDRAARDELLAGRPHVFEAEMKEDRRTHGRAHHEARPVGGPDAIA